MNSEQALAILLQHASTLDVPYPHWLGGENVDQGPSYCRACADAKVAAGEAEYVDGGWQQDDDNCCHCEVCQRLLEYNLTEYGFATELEHYRSNPPAAPLDPEDAFHIAKVLECDPENAEAVAIAVAAALLIEPSTTAQPAPVLSSSPSRA